MLENRGSRENIRWLETPGHHALSGQSYLINGSEYLGFYLLVVYLSHGCSLRVPLRGQAVGPRPVVGVLKACVHGIVAVDTAIKGPGVGAHGAIEVVALLRRWAHGGNAGVVGAVHGGLALGIHKSVLDSFIEHGGREFTGGVLARVYLVALVGVAALAADLAYVDGVAARIGVRVAVGDFLRGVGV